MDSVSHPTNVVMETGSVLMAVMNSTAVSTELLARFLYHCLIKKAEMFHPTMDGFEGEGKGGLCSLKYQLCLTSGGTLGIAHYEHCSTSPVYAVLTELRDRDCVKATADYAKIPSTSEETKVFSPLMHPEV